MAGNIVISQINGGPIGVINAIINGNFQVNQRGVSGTVTLAAGAYGHDRWKAGASGCTYTFATVNNVTTLTISSGSLIQVIEGLNLYSGTYALSWSGTAQGKIGAGSYSGSGVTGSVTGGTNLNIEFGTGTLSLVQFEPGVEATPFERRDYGRELMMCERYYQALTDNMRISAMAFNSTVVPATWAFKTTMRAAPTTTATVGTSTILVGGSNLPVTSIGGGVSSVYGYSMDVSVASGATAGFGAELRIVGGRVAASAEL